MNRAFADPIANAVLYEGYILYPCRPSNKNRQRWTFGGLIPESFCQAHQSGDLSSQQTECLIRGEPATTVQAVGRFLHLTDRQIGQIDPPRPHSAEGAVPTFRPVETLRVGDRLFQNWQEAEEREVALGPVTLGELVSRPRTSRFAFPNGRRLEPLVGTSGEIIGLIIRVQHAIQGVIRVETVKVDECLFRLTLNIANLTPLEDAHNLGRDEALLRSMVSTHAILGVNSGAFLSLIDPPEPCRDAAAACRNHGTWPVLIGSEDEADTMLSSPIVLYDNPRVAPESPGDFFDGTEIDEMLTLRIMTLTEEEKRAMVAVDDRAADLLARTEALAREQLLGLHGTVRDLRTISEEGTHA